MDKPAIGMIGLGLLGGALAERLIAAGFDVAGYDIDPSRMEHLRALGGLGVANPADIARRSRIVLSLPTSQIAAEVVDALKPGLTAGAIVVDTTTGDPEEIEAIGRDLAAAGVAYLDATVGGSSAQARAKDVVVMVGGDAEAVRACGPLFDAFARQTFHVGPCGSGARMKLAVNLVLGLNRAVLAEGLSFAQALGLDPEMTLEILKSGPAWSRVMDTKGRKMLDRDFAPQAKLAQHRKDVELILAAAARSGGRVPLSTLHAQLLRALEAEGWANLDNSAIIKAFE